MFNPSETSFEKSTANGTHTTALAPSWRETQRDWQALQSNVTATSNAHQFLPTLIATDTNYDRRNLHRALSKFKADDDTISIDISVDVPPPTAEQMADKLDETQRKAYDEILQALRDGDLDRIAEIAKQFDADPSKFKDVYKCLAQALREGQVKDTAMIWKYDSKTNSADLKIMQGDKRVAIHIGQ